MKRLLFVNGGSRWKFDRNGDVYTDANFSQEIWDRYANLCDELTVILRKESKIYTVEEACAKFNKVNTEKVKIVVLPDIYAPKRNFCSLKLRKQIKGEISNQVKSADKIILRSLVNTYTCTALKACVKHNKLYLVEVAGFLFEGLWYHSLVGKALAPFRELRCKHNVKKAKFVSYVTEEALQKRYPCMGKSLGCSDVEILGLDDSVLINRLQKIESNDGLILGTAAFLDVSWKGQRYVIKALHELKRQGYSNIEYQLIGGGSGDKLKKYAAKLGVAEQVKIIGGIPHSDVFAWLDKIDVYIQPSFQEGLCRAIVEAMSRACPVICSDVGGNYELISSDCLFKKGDVAQICKEITFLMDENLRIDKAKANFIKSFNYDKDRLAKKRNKFYEEFMET